MVHNRIRKPLQRAFAASLLAAFLAAALLPLMPPTPVHAAPGDYTVEGFVESSGEVTIVAAIDQLGRVHGVSIDGTFIGTIGLGHTTEIVSGSRHTLAIPPEVPVLPGSKLTFLGGTYTFYAAPKVPSLSVPDAGYLAIRNNGSTTSPSGDGAVWLEATYTAVSATDGTVTTEVFRGAFSVVGAFPSLLPGSPVQARAYVQEGDGTLLCETWAETAYVPALPLSVTASNSAPALGETVTLAAAYATADIDYVLWYKDTPDHPYNRAAAIHQGNTLEATADGLYTAVGYKNNLPVTLPQPTALRFNPLALRPVTEGDATVTVGYPGTANNVTLTMDGATHTGLALDGETALTLPATALPGSTITVAIPADGWSATAAAAPLPPVVEGTVYSTATGVTLRPGGSPVDANGDPLLLEAAIRTEDSQGAIANATLQGSFAIDGSPLALEMLAPADLAAGTILAGEVRFASHTTGGAQRSVDATAAVETPTLALTAAVDSGGSITLAAASPEFPGLAAVEWSYTDAKTSAATTLPETGLTLSITQPGMYTATGTLGGRAVTTATQLLLYGADDSVVTPFPTYTGAQQTLTATVEEDAAGFAALTFGGKALTPGVDFDVQAGSTVLTLYPAFYEPLADGAHTLYAHYSFSGYGTLLPLTLTVAREEDNGGNNPGGGNGGNTPGGNGNNPGGGNGNTNGSANGGANTGNGTGDGNNTGNTGGGTGGNGTVNNGNGNTTGGRGNTITAGKIASSGGGPARKDSAIAKTGDTAAPLWYVLSALFAAAGGAAFIALQRRRQL